MGLPGKFVDFAQWQGDLGYIQRDSLNLMHHFDGSERRI